MGNTFFRFSIEEKVIEFTVRYEIYEPLEL